MTDADGAGGADYVTRRMSHLLGKAGSSEMKPMQDLGRPAVVLVAAFLGLGNVVNFVRSLPTLSVADPSTWLKPAASALVVAFYALVVVLYLRRGSAQATTGSRPAKVVAVVASWLPLALPYVSGTIASTRMLLTAEVLLVTGMVWSVVALRTLGRSFSIVAQARTVVRSGPYAVVRHPLYLGELVAALGIVLRAPSVAGFAVWCLLAGLQIHRTRHEERILSEALPDYSSYRALTRWRIVPGLV